MNRFERIVHRLGEPLYIIDGENLLPFKASLKESTHATYSQNNRANFFEGQALKRTTDGTKTIVDVGSYIRRECDKDIPYLAAATLPEPTSNDSLCYLYLIRCNDRVTIDRYGETVDPDNPSEIITGWRPIATDIWCNKDIVTRSMKGTIDGLLDQAIYLVTLPKSFGVQVLDRVKIGESYFRVESKNDILSSSDLIGGLDMLQLTYFDEHRQVI